MRLALTSLTVASLLLGSVGAATGAPAAPPPPRLTAAKSATSADWTGDADGRVRAHAHAHAHAHADVTIPHVTIPHVTNTDVTNTDVTSTDAPAGTVVPGELLLRPLGPDAPLLAALDGLGLDLRDDAGPLGVWRVGVPDGRVVDGVAALLAARPDVVWAAPHALLAPAQAAGSLAPVPPTDPAVALQTFLDAPDEHDIDAFDAWARTGGRGAGVVVAVIDTGAPIGHPDIDAQLWVNPGEIPGNGRDDDGNGHVDDVHGVSFVGGDVADRTGHGTSVAGLVAMAADNGIDGVGVAPDARILSVKVFDRVGAAADATIAEAILYARDQGASIVNLSLGSPSASPATRDAMLASPDLTFVVAAGNDGASTPNYPAAYPVPNLVSVGALDASRDRIANYSNRHASVDVFAPGTDMLMPTTAGPTTVATTTASGDDRLVWSGLGPGETDDPGAWASGLLAAADLQPAARTLFVDDDGSEDGYPSDLDGYLQALAGYGRVEGFDTRARGRAPTTAELSAYTQVVWTVGASTSNALQPGRDGATRLVRWLDGGARRLVVSGSEALWDIEGTALVQRLGITYWGEGWTGSDVELAGRRFDVAGPGAAYDSPWRDRVTLRGATEIGRLTDPAAMVVQEGTSFAAPLVTGIAALAQQASGLRGRALADRVSSTTLRSSDGRPVADALRAVAPAIASPPTVAPQFRVALAERGRVVFERTTPLAEGELGTRAVTVTDDAERDGAVITDVVETASRFVEVDVPEDLQRATVAGAGVNGLGVGPTGAVATARIPLGPVARARVVARDATSITIRVDEPGLSSVRALGVTAAGDADTTPRTASALFDDAGVADLVLGIDGDSASARVVVTPVFRDAEEGPSTTRTGPTTVLEVGPADEPSADSGTVTSPTDPTTVRTVLAGGTAALPTALSPALERLRAGPAVRRAGATRLTTAAAIVEDAFAGRRGGTVVVAVSTNFPDALAGAAVAARLDAPLVLADGEGAVPANDTLRTLRPDRILVLGGAGVISDRGLVRIRTALGGGVVERLAGDDRYATAAQASAAAFTAADTVYVVTGRTFPDALAAGTPAAVEDAPILLVRDRLDAATAAEVRRLGATRAVVVGGTVAVPDAVVRDLQDLGLTVVRRAGADRYATAAAAVGAVFDDPPVVYVATGRNFPDALAAGPSAAHLGGTLVLVDGADVPASTADLLRGWG